MNTIQMLQQVSRTFALSIEQLPDILCRAVSLSYLLLRVSDCLEDHESIPASQKPHLLRLWTEVLDDHRRVGELTSSISYLDQPGDSEAQVALHAAFLLEQLRALPEEVIHIITRRVKQTSMGMARWQEHAPVVENENEMDDYMHQVAGLVGYLLTDIFSWYSPVIRKRRTKLMPLSRQYGLALQTVNIIRGMRKDYERGWVYVPRTFYEDVGLSKDELFMAGNIEKALLVVNKLADKAEKHLSYGLQYIINFPFNQHHIRLGCMWPLFFAIKTLAISRNNPLVITAEAKLERKQVKKIMTDTWLFGWMNPWLSRYYQYLSVP